MKMRKSEREAYLRQALNTPVDESYLYETKIIKRENINHPNLPISKMDEYTMYFLGCLPYVVKDVADVRKVFRSDAEQIEMIVCKYYSQNRTVFIENDRDTWFLSVNGYMLGVYTREEIFKLLY